MTMIKILSNDLIGKIAAGEVVERPASVVKELVENAIDADAREIVVDIESGGKRRIIVIDDGCGMTAEDAKLSVLRHATSKISTDTDLENIHTMGFRGEALPSIAAVSKMTIETKSPPLEKGGKGGFGPSEDISGFKLVLSAGEVVESGEFGCADGTRIVIEELFFNTPARKKFLRGDKTEEGHVIDSLSRLAMAFPDIRFKLTSDGKEKLACLLVGDPRTRLLEVFGATLAASAIQFEEKGSGISIHGFLGTPDTAKQVAQGVYLFVNNRFVRDRLLNHAVSDGYRSLLPRGSYPFAVVMLNLDPERVDVNVHPTKQEVRFDNVGAVHGFVANAVRKAVTRTTRQSVVAEVALPEYVAQDFSPANTGRSKDLRYETDKATGDCHVALRTPSATTPSADRRNDTQFVASGEATSRLANARSKYKVIGQLANSFILCEAMDGRLIVIDQHAAHERIGFEKLKKQFAENKIEQQHLLFPEQVELQPKEAAYITEHLEILNQLGIELEPFGGRTFVIKAIPALLSDTNIKELILRLSHELADIGRSTSAEEVTEHILKTMACHRQVRAGQRLSEPEMQALLTQMDEWPNAGHCPHGRPSFVEFGSGEIAKWFKRT